MEVDLYVPNNVLYLDSSGLFTTSKSSTDRLTQNLIGKFNFITSFAQLNSTHIIVTDTQMHCLYSYNRVNKKKSEFAGSCSAKGSTDGSLKNARLDAPFRLTRSDNKTIRYLYFEEPSDKIRSVDIQHSTVNTVFDSIEGNLLGLAVESENELVALGKVDNTHYIKRLSMIAGKKASVSTIFRRPFGTKSLLDGSFSEASFIDPIPIRNIAYRIFIVLQTNGFLRIVDNSVQRISTLCSAAALQQSNFASCKFESSTALALDKDHVYIGNKKGILISDRKYTFSHNSSSTI